MDSRGRRVGGCKSRTIPVVSTARARHAVTGHFERSRGDHRGRRRSTHRGATLLDPETRLFYIAVGGVALAAIGLLWLIVASFRVKWYWGLAVLLFLPIALPIFIIRHLKASAWPLAIVAIGLAIGSAPIVYNKVTPVDLGPYERKVGDEIHLTLTKWDRKDYSILADRPGTVVLQMANPDVTDSTLINLKGMAKLRELDLSNTQVDDDGLKELEPLAGLESLRLKGTKITDEGFKKWLEPRGTLRQLDLRGTAVTKETGKAWRDAKDGRRLLQ
jgi:Leucine Rich repeat